MINLLLTLFFTFLKIGFFSIGGGYAIIPLIQEQVVKNHGWLTLREFTDIITISQMTPGPLAINTSTFVGMRIAEIPGATVASVGAILTGFIFSIILYRFFQRHKNLESVANILLGLHSASLGLIASAGATILFITFVGDSKVSFNVTNYNLIAIAIFAFSLFALRKLKLNPILIIAISGIIGLFAYS